MSPRAINHKVVELNYKKFDVLNPKYDILQFGLVQVRKRFRYHNKWLTKSGPGWAFERTTCGTPLYFMIKDDQFVLIVKDSPLNHKA